MHKPKTMQEYGTTEDRGVQHICMANTVSLMQEHNTGGQQTEEKEHIHENHS